jgi:hypothetical protein
MSRATTIALLTAAVLLLTLATGRAVGQGACGFQLGFKALHDLIPAIVGDCREDEHHNPDNGDGLQQTTNGLLVWRQADNWTAFTDGTTTWINGPEGLQARPNGERLPWESSLPNGASGIEGQVTLGPTCPGPVRPGQVCERPYQATITVLDQQGQDVTQFQSGADGRFQVPLAPGRYTLRPESPGALPRAGQLTVTVNPGRWTEVSIDYDTGLR